MSKLELEFTNSPDVLAGKVSPVDKYIEALTAGITAAKTYQCELIPTESASSPAFKITDAETGFTSYLHRVQEKDFIKYTLTVSAADGSVAMCSNDWVAPIFGESPLHQLYVTLTELVMQPEDDEATAAVLENSTDAVDPDDDVTLTNAFIDALLEDVQGQRPGLQFERRGDNFVADSFGISESTITLTKDWEDDTSARFFIKMEHDGVLVLSCAETSKNDNEEAELRKLYRLLDEKLPIVTTDTATIDVQAFVQRKAFDTFFDRVIQYAIPAMSTIEPEVDEKAILIYDLFEGVSEPAVIRQFLDEVAIRRGPLSEPQHKQLKALAQGVFTIMRNVKRNPHGRVFTGRAIAVAFDKPGLASRIRWGSSIAKIANSYITWGEELFGPQPAIGEGHAATKTAVLILAAVLSDQLP